MTFEHEQAKRAPWLLVSVHWARTRRAALSSSGSGAAAARRAARPDVSAARAGPGLGFGYGYPRGRRRRGYGGAAARPRAASTGLRPAGPENTGRGRRATSSCRRGRRRGRRRATAVADPHHPPYPQGGPATLSASLTSSKVPRRPSVSALPAAAGAAAPGPVRWELLLRATGSAPPPNYGGAPAQQQYGAPPGQGQYGAPPQGQCRSPQGQQYGGAPPQGATLRGGAPPPRNTARHRQLPVARRRTSLPGSGRRRAAATPATLVLSSRDYSDVRRTPTSARCHHLRDERRPPRSRQAYETPRSMITERKYPARRQRTDVTITRRFPARARDETYRDDDRDARRGGVRFFIQVRSPSRTRTHRAGRTSSSIARRVRRAGARRRACGGAGCS